MSICQHVGLKLNMQALTDMILHVPHFMSAQKMLKVPCYVLNVLENLKNKRIWHFSGHMPVATFRAGFLRQESGLRVPDLSLSGANAQPAGVRPLHGTFDDDNGFNAFSPQRSVARPAADAESTGNAKSASKAPIKGEPPRDVSEPDSAAPPGVFFANTTKGKATGRFRCKRSGSASGPSSAQ